MITQQQLKSRLHYDRESGVFRWRNVVGSSNIKPWDISGTPHNKGYISIQINGKRYQAHRLAWLYEHGEFPNMDIDHKNGIKNENRLSNLRLATNSENHCNTGLRSTNKSGVKGVHWHKGIKRWVASARFEGKQHIVGTYSDLRNAASAIEAFRNKHHGQYAKHARAIERAHGIGVKK